MGTLSRPSDSLRIVVAFNRVYKVRVSTARLVEKQHGCVRFDSSENERNRSESRRNTRLRSSWLGGSLETIGVARRKEKRERFYVSLVGFVTLESDSGRSR